MKKRITVAVDEELVEQLKELGAPSISAAVNAAIREAVELELHRKAALEWIDELDQKHGYPTDEDYALADDILDEAGFGGERRAPRKGAA